MEKNVEISILCQLYGKLLSEKQLEFIDDYYNNDLSLSEIAENHGITRQAVRDMLKKGEKKLFEYEEKLLFMKRMLNQEKKIEEIHSFIPLSEMFGYATELRSRTQGRGTYSMEPSHYDEVPKSVLEAIVASRKKD